MASNDATKDAKATPEGELDDEVCDGQDIFYVPQKDLEALKKGEKKEDEVKAFLDKVIHPENVNDEEIMIPVDMRGAGKDYMSIEEMVSELGQQGAVDAFIKARAYFEANKDGEPEDDRPKPMSAKEWKQVMEEDGEEELLEDEEEEEVFDEDAEEEDAEEEGGEEPPAKKIENRVKTFLQILTESIYTFCRYDSMIKQRKLLR